MNDEQLINDDLISLLCSGNHKAFMRIYDAYHSLLFKFICQYITNTDQAEDILHDVFMDLWESRQRVKTGRPILPYLYRICRNHVYDALKEHYRREAFKSGFEKTNQNTFATSPAETLQQREYDALLQSAVAHLPAQRQKVFRLCRQQGNNYQQVAVIMGISRHTVKEHMSLAIKSINEYVNAHTITVLYGVACASVL